MDKQEGFLSLSSTLATPVSGSRKGQRAEGMESTETKLQLLSALCQVSAAQPLPAERKNQRKTSRVVGYLIFGEFVRGTVT